MNLPSNWKIRKGKNGIVATNQLDTSIEIEGDTLYLEYTSYYFNEDGGHEHTSNFSIPIEIIIQMLERTKEKTV